MSQRCLSVPEMAAHRNPADFLRSDDNDGRLWGLGPVTRKVRVKAAFVLGKVERATLAGTLIAYALSRWMISNLRSMTLPRRWSAPSMMRLSSICAERSPMS
jgi:hypothetical protein